MAKNGAKLLNPKEGTHINRKSLQVFPLAQLCHLGYNICYVVESMTKMEGSNPCLRIHRPMCGQANAAL